MVTGINGKNDSRHFGRNDLWVEASAKLLEFQASFYIQAPASASAEKVHQGIPTAAGTSLKDGIVFNHLQTDSRIIICPWIRLPVSCIPTALGDRRGVENLQ